jgi:hypothetical protein
MSELFVDTAGWGHLVDPTQKCHLLAAALYRSGRQQRQITILNKRVLSVC